jgi:hypothetical protein
MLAERARHRKAGWRILPGAGLCIALAREAPRAVSETKRPARCISAPGRPFLARTERLRRS